MAKIKVQDTEVTITSINGEDYICLTNMIRAKDGDFFVTDWLRNRNTLEFIGIWEKVYNPSFNPSLTFNCPFFLLSSTLRFSFAALCTTNFSRF